MFLLNFNHTAYSDCTVLYSAYGTVPVPYQQYQHGITVSYHCTGKAIAMART